MGCASQKETMRSFLINGVFYTEWIVKKTIGIWLALSLAACGGSDNNSTASGSPTASPGATPATPPPTSANVVTVADLERQGKLPTLDRSADLKGPDIDNNGIRDDIDRWIQNQPYTEPQKQAALQVARVLQNILSVDVTNDAALREAGDASRKAVTCVYARFPVGDQPNPNTVIKTLQKYTMNTKARVTAYLAYSDALNGSVSDIPSGENCA